MAGSPYPDWGYSCDRGDAGEDGHWPPFVEAYIRYIKTNYQKGTKEYD